MEMTNQHDTVDVINSHVEEQYALDDGKEIGESAGSVTTDQQVLLVCHSIPLSQDTWK